MYLIYFMFLSGLTLWQTVSVSWEVERWMLLLHIAIGSSVFTLVVGAFWCSHRRLILTSRNAFLRTTGTLIEWLLATCVLTGFYLFIYGKTGNTLSLVIQELHFYSSWILVPLVLRHAFRWSIFNLRQIVSFFKKQN